MSDYETILIEREGRVARVSFNRPDKLNSFNGTMRREFLRAAQEVNADRDIWVVLLTGAGRAFGAGADLSDTSEPMPNGGEGVEDQLNAEYKPACWRSITRANPGSPRSMVHAPVFHTPTPWHAI